jgi:hypothetical protein
LTPAARFKAFLFADHPLHEVVGLMARPSGALADALACLRRGDPAEAEAVLSAAALVHPKEVGGGDRLVLAAAQLARGRRQAATATLRAAADFQGETRFRLWACRALRDLGETPADPTAGTVLGVVVEVAAAGGVDTVAAYADGSARYLGAAGARVSWDAPDERLASRIDAVLAAAAPVVPTFAPDIPGRGDPAPGTTRFTLLTGAGARLGDEPTAALAVDPPPGPRGALFRAAAGLLAALQALAIRAPR